MPPDPKPAFRVHRGVAGVAVQQATQEDAAGDDEKTQEDHGPPDDGMMGVRRDMEMCTIYIYIHIYIHTYIYIMYTYVTCVCIYICVCVWLSD